MVNTEKSFAKDLVRLTSANLVKIRLMAIRHGVWFKVLTKLERGLVDLSLKVTKRIRSKMLAKAISSIVKKLLKVLKNNIRLQMIVLGIPLAEKISRIAQKWGNKNAQEWASNIGFIQYLALMKMNTHLHNA